MKETRCGVKRRGTASGTGSETRRRRPTRPWQRGEGSCIATSHPVPRGTEAGNAEQRASRCDLTGETAGNE